MGGVAYCHALLGPLEAIRFLFFLGEKMGQLSMTGFTIAKEIWPDSILVIMIQSLMHKSERIERRGLAIGILSSLRARSFAM